MMRSVSFPSSVGEVSGVLAVPSGTVTGPGVIVLHEWWGVTEQIQGILRRWADEGFVALAPDLYHGQVIRIGDAPAARAAMDALEFGKAVQEIAGAVAYLQQHPRCTGKVAVTGYCMGGALAFASAVDLRGLAAVVPFYGLPGDLDWTKIDAPVQAHFAQHDDWATVAGARAIQAVVTAPMELHVYDAHHAFCNERRPEVYDADAATAAWGRAVAFVRQHAR